MSKEIKNNNTRTNRSVGAVEQVTQAPDLSQLPKIRTNKWEDNYKRSTVFIQNDTMDELNRRVGREKGEKTRIVNEALQEYFERNPFV